MRARKDTYQLNKQETQNLYVNFWYAANKGEMQFGNISHQSGVPRNRLSRMVFSKPQEVSRMDLDSVADALGLSVQQLVHRNLPQLSSKTKGTALHPGELLRTWRNRRRLSQREVAEQLDLLPHQVSLTERGFNHGLVDQLAVFLAPHADALNLIRKSSGEAIVIPTKLLPANNTRGHANLFA